MPSPFPGMDPYLEEPSLWPDVHLTMLVAMRSELTVRLPERYAAFADRYVWLHEPDSETRTRLGKPDVYRTGRHRSENGPATSVLEAPATAILPVVRHQGSRYLRIVDRRSRRVITVIELLSPSKKKPGEDSEAYLSKRNEYIATSTNLVEIDLLRGGVRMPMGDPAPPPVDYYVFVCRAADFPRTAIWPFSVRESLPTVPVPLNPEDTPVPLALRPCLDRAYAEARYEREVDYSEPPDPPLAESDATWARELLARRPR